MLLASTLTSLGLVSAALAIPLDSIAPTNSTAQNVVYWGQNGGTALENDDLAIYCPATSGIDIIVLSFLYKYGGGRTIPSDAFGQSCSISADGHGVGCEKLSAAIDTCKGNGVKIIMSLGGATDTYSLTSQQEAEAIGQNLWDAYGNTVGTASVPRPFGKTFVDGWDFDIEHNSGNEFYQFMINKLRSNFASDAANTYLITGAPQCPVPEPNMNQIITAAKFDYLFVQFYNNPGCSAGDSTGPNFDAWKTNIANTPSASVKIFLGAPASRLAGTGTESGAKYYLEPSQLAELMGGLKKDEAFGGVMMWNAGFSGANVHNGCTYAQEAKHILTEGTIC